MEGSKNSFYKAVIVLASVSFLGLSASPRLRVLRAKFFPDHDLDGFSRAVSVEVRLNGQGHGFFPVPFRFFGA